MAVVSISLCARGFLLSINLEEPNAVVLAGRK